MGMGGIRQSQILIATLTLITLFGTMVQSSMPNADDETFKAHFPTAWASGISPLCHNDSQLFFYSYINRDKWATESINSCF